MPFGSQSTLPDRTSHDNSLVLRLLSAILLSGCALLVVADGGRVASLPLLVAGLVALWGTLAVTSSVGCASFKRRGFVLLWLGLEMAAIGGVAGALPEASGLPVFFLGPVTVAAVRLGREGALAAATMAALVLLLPMTLRGEVSGPVAPAPGLGVVLLLTSGLVAGELVRLAERRRRVEHRTAVEARRSGREIQLILDSLGSGLLTVDAAGCLTRINPRGRALLGLAERECGYRPLGALLASGGEGLADLVLQALSDGRRRQRCEVVVQRRDVEVPLGLNVDILSAEDGSLEGAVAFFTDLTEVKRLQAQLRRSDRLAGVGELAASIAHELRNPLASIRGSVELLAGELEVEGHQAQLLQLILRESARLNTIITDFLAFARLRPAQPRPVELEPFLAQVVLQLRQHVHAQGGKVDVSSDCESPDVWVQADAEQLVQAFLNLGLNACEAMCYQGELKIRAAARGEQCELRIHDTGPGLEPGKAEEIFTPFVTTKPHGTGLGLPMVARIVHAHGGTIEAGNNPAGGAEMVLRLSLARAATASRSEKEPQDAECELAVF